MATAVSDDGHRTMLSCLDCCNVTTPQFRAPNLGLAKKNVSRKEIQQTEEMLASEMNRLTVQERAEALDDIHCVGEELKETPEMIQQSLREFELAVQNEKNLIYQMAASQNQSYVEDPSFRLKFLRANMHNVHRSVRQMMNFLRYKATYFGNDKVARDITLDDLNEEDMKWMLSGLFHIQDGRDQSGRVIIYLSNTLLGKCKADTLIRVAYYIWFNILIPIPEVQMKGLVGVYFDASKPGENIAIPGFNSFLTIMSFTCSLPMRYSAAHLCVKGEDKGNLALNNAILGFAMNAYPQSTRVRSRLHHGSTIELQYQLRPYGIPINTCPIDTAGNIRTDILNVWFQKHLELEALKNQSLQDIPAPNDQDMMMLLPNEEELDGLFGDYDAGGNIDFEEGSRQTVDDFSSLDFINRISPVAIEARNEKREAKPASIFGPTETDVVLGRGRDIQNHEGNIRFRKLLVEYHDEYDVAPRFKRRKIVTDLRELLNSRGIRFLQQRGSNEWEEVDTKAAELKIAQLFRSIRKKKGPISS
ncbi:unnamed protein product [Cylindrotheca closterium]|uniref:DUF6824 domain-containing protein n=1 Tax=Cylindrotheca closterium TaxID=2856 RepID=A0AAD2CNH5_9STRA|nr:unnamed protein product [Cylindrotheca closterium]